MEAAHAVATRARVFGDFDRAEDAVHDAYALALALEGDPLDDRLAMILAACHPALHEETRIALTLRFAAGLNVGEIASALLASPATIAQRLVRAKQKIRRARIAFAVPDVAVLLLLEDQNRGLWDSTKISRGIALLAQDVTTRWGPYRLQASIVAEHARAKSWKATNWHRICRYYDLLLEIDPSPVVALNRAVAVAYAQGSEQGLALIELTRNEPERRYLQAKLAELMLNG
jgi:RNA polymerase sigma-70 factor, ECF subfamily